MIRKSYFLLSLLQAVLSQEWKGNTPQDVTAQEGLCAAIPCHYSYPSRLANDPRAGIWFNNEKLTSSSVAFHSKDHNRESPRLHHRTRLSGDLKDGDCSLIINDITQQDAGPYYFRIEFDKQDKFSYYPVTRLHVSDFTDKPTIFPAEIIAGKRVNVSCTFNTTCTGTAPVLTWVNAADVPGSVSNSVTQHGVTLTYTSVLTLIPSIKHHGQTLTCRVKYPSVSSEQTLALTVHYAPRNLSITSLDTIKDSSINIKEGNSTVIRCSVKSFPASNLTWRHLGVTMSRTSSNNELWLEFPHVTSRVAGDYQCVAENKHGAVERTITVMVEHAPRNLSITSLDMIRDSSINIKEGNSTVILCSVESFPASNLTWRHLGVTMNRTSSNNKLWLEFPHVMSRVAGDYQCVAENEHGAVERTIAITVEYAPRNLSITSLDMIKNSSINIKEGNSTVILCSVESFPASNLMWQHLGVTMNRTSSNNELWLEFPHVTSRVAGDYQCMAENKQGAVERTITIIVEYAPRNLSITSLDMIRDSSINIIEGNSTVILCSVESFPASNLTWRHLGVTMNRTSSNNKLWLEFPHVTSRVAGDYQCVAENEHGAVERTITITVEYAPQNLSITSLDMIKDSSINIKEGNSTVILCSVESFPASNLTWQHLGLTMNRTSSNNELWLEFPHVASRVAGDYQCMAENKHGAVERTITITVEYAPRNLSITSLDMIKDSSINIKEGNSTVILCSVESFPASNLMWRHLGVTMNRTSSNNELWLEFPHVTSRVAGDYQCVAENEHGAVERTIAITVEYAPRNLSFTSLDMIKDSSINIKEGNSTVILCSVESFPASNLMWQHLGLTMNRTSSNNELWLEFPNVTSRVTGDYQCMAENKHGAVERTITITVEYAPRNLLITSLDMIKNSSINIKEGHATGILCSVESFPASNLTWRHLGVTMNRTSSNNKLWLEFPHVTSRVAGDYQCVAENEHGAVQRTITITVEYAPRNLSITSCDMIKDSSINIKEGNSTVILCSVESFPASNLTWRHLGVTMNRTSSKNKLWLGFPHVTSRVAGDYQCVAENEHGVVERTITITVEHPPKETTVAISGATGGIREGSNITLTCFSESVPPASSYVWFRIDGNTIAQLNTSARSIYFNHVTRENDASFYCTARNPLGNGTSTIVHLSVEYKPEISRESECAQKAESVTCVCAARSNPPGNLTWHLPLTNVSGNQTHGLFMTWRVSNGQLVTSFLTLTGSQGKEEATVFCSVRNQHGEAMFKVYPWVKGRDSNKWKVGLLAAGIMLIVVLAGLLIFKCMRKRKAATEERAPEPSDIAMTCTLLSVKHQGMQSEVVVDPGNTTNDATSEAETPAPQGLSEGPAGGDAGHGQPAKHEDLLYANINFLKLPCGDGTVHRGEDTEYAEIRFQ